MSIDQSSTASLSELIDSDSAAALISLLSPLLVFGQLVAGIGLLLLSLPLMIVESLVGDGSTLVEVVLIIGLTLTISIHYLVPAYFVYGILFSESSADGGTGILFAGSKIGGDASAFFWWLIIPIIPVGILFSGFWDDPTVFGKPYPTMALIIFLCLVVLVRLRGVYQYIHGNFESLLSILTCYFIVAGSFEGASFLIADSTISESIFEVDEIDNIENEDLGMVGLYYPVLAVGQLLDIIGIIEVSDGFGIFAEIFLFNTASGDGFLLSLSIAVVVLPTTVYAAGLLCSIRWLVWYRVVSTARTIVDLFMSLAHSTQTAVIIFANYSLFIISYIIFLRPPE